MSKPEDEAAWRPLTKEDWFAMGRDGIVHSASTPRQCASSSTASARSRESTDASPAAACDTASGEELR